MASHYTRRYAITPHDFGGVLGRPLGTFFWALTNFTVTALGLCVKWPLFWALTNYTVTTLGSCVKWPLFWALTNFMGMDFGSCVKWPLFWALTNFTVRALGSCVKWSYLGSNWKKGGQPPDKAPPNVRPKVRLPRHTWPTIRLLNNK